MMNTAPGAITDQAIAHTTLFNSDGTISHVSVKVQVHINNILLSMITVPCIEKWVS